MENFCRKLGDLDIFKKHLGNSRIFRRQKQILGYFRNFRRCGNPEQQSYQNSQKSVFLALKSTGYLLP